MKQMKHLMKLAIPAMALAGAMGVSSVAQAVPISDYLAVRGPNAAGGPSQTGPNIAYNGVSETDEIAGVPVTVNGIPVDPSQNFNPIFLCDPSITGGCDPNSPNFYISDIVGIANTPTGMVLAFASDFEDSLGPFVPGVGTLVPESDFEMDVTKFLDPALRAGGITAWFRSSDVPEPTSLALLGTGLIGLAARARKRKAG